MLTKERQKKHFDQAWKAMLAHLQDYYASLDPEDLHRFRVKAKKVYALLQYLHKGAERKSLEQAYQPVRNIFKQAGEIRSIQVHLILLQQADCSDAAFIGQQKIALRSATKLFCTQPALHLDTIRTVCRASAGHFHDIGKRRIIRMFNKKIDRLHRSFANEEGTARRWHDNRKSIKQLLFLYEFLPKILKKAVALNTVYLEQLAELIGQWHDVEMTLELFPDAGSVDALSLDQLNRQLRELKKDVRARILRFEEHARLM